jgi:hypothetical protein
MTQSLFVCEGCGKVCPSPCTCPEGGHTVAQIKQALIDSPTIGDVNHTAKHFGRHVALLEREGGDARTMAIQIKNLAAYRRWQINRSFNREPQNDGGTA